jgi:hypothetical protein
MTGSPRGELTADADSARPRQTQRPVGFPRRLCAHSLAYLAVNAALWAIWALTGASYPWPAWATGGSGVALLMDAWAGVEIRREIGHPRP